MIKTLLQETHAEASAILHTARQEQLAGIISWEAYVQIRQAVFDAIAKNIGTAMLFGEEVAIATERS